MDLKLALAIATLAGTIIGVGFFGIPYVISQVGFLPGIFYLFLLAGVTLTLHLLFSEIVLRTKETLRLPGFAEKYLGKMGKDIISISTFFSISSALICYILAGSEFLNTLFDFSPFLLGLLFWFLLSLGIWLGIKNISRVELFMLFLFFIILGGIFFVSLPKINLENLRGFYPENLFLPYGVILFAMAGTAAVPTIREILQGREKDLKKAILIGTIIPAIFYALFTFSVVGVSGTEATEEAISGLVAKLGVEITFWGIVIGLLAISTSFLTLGIYLRDVMLYDFKVGKTIATSFVTAIPLFGLLLGKEHLILLMGFIGVILGAFENVILILISKKAKIKGDRKPEYEIKIPGVILWILCILFILGLIYEVILFFSL